MVSTDLASMPAWVMPTVLLLGAWSMVWKGLALYRAGKLKQPLWFIVMFLVNTLGVLEIFYILVFSKMVKAPKEASDEMKPSI